MEIDSSPISDGVGFSVFVFVGLLSGGEGLSVFVFVGFLVSRLEIFLERSLELAASNSGLLLLSELLVFLLSSFNRSIEYFLSIQLRVGMNITKRTAIMPIR